MAYKESNPAMIHIVQFIIILSVMALIHLFLALIFFNGFVSLATESEEIILPSLMIAYVGASCIFPYVIPIYFIVGKAQDIVYPFILMFLVHNIVYPK